MKGDDLAAEFLMNKYLNNYNMKKIRSTCGLQLESKINTVALTAEL